MIRRKSRRREPKLLRGGNVLGVVDDQQFAARLRQRKIERAGLGRWRSRRRDDDFVARRQIERQKAGHRRAIPPLHDQLDVQFRLRIVERVKRGDELPDDGALAIEGRDDRINRQFVVGSMRGRFSSGFATDATPRNPIEARNSIQSAADATIART